MKKILFTTLFITIIISCIFTLQINAETSCSHIDSNNDGYCDTCNYFSFENGIRINQNDISKFKDDSYYYFKGVDIIFDGVFSFDLPIVIENNVRFYLCDSCIVNANNGIIINSKNGLNSLDIYSESISNNMGTLNVINSNTKGDTIAIGCSKDSSNNYYSFGKLVINGGHINAITNSSVSNSSSIGGGPGSSCGNIVINNGIVYAETCGNGAAIGNGYTTKKLGGSITINGGTVTAINKKSSGVALGTVNSNDNTNNIVINKNSLIYTGKNIDDATISNSYNRELFITVADKNSDIQISFSNDFQIPTDNETIKYGFVAHKPDYRYHDKYMFLGYFEDENYLKEFDFSKQLFEDTTIYEKWIPYGNVIDNSIDISPTNVSSLDFQGLCYSISGNITISDRITVDNYLLLYLKDNSNITFQKGIYVPEGCYLYVFSESLNSDSMGKLTSFGYGLNSGAQQGAAIGGYGTNNGGVIAIFGGNVTTSNITNGINAASIGGGSSSTSQAIIINNGIINASSDNAAAIGTGMNFTGSIGKISIQGGTIIASSKKADKEYKPIGYGTFSLETNNVVNSFVTPNANVDFSGETNNQIITITHTTSPITTPYKLDNPSIEFKTMSLLLDGDLGAVFYVKVLDTSELTTLRHSYMEISIDGGNSYTIIPFNKSTYDSTKGKYAFTFYENVLEVSKLINIKYHYGFNGEYKELNTSIEAYLKAYYNQNKSNQVKANLCKSIANYCYYSQLALKETYKFEFSNETGGIKQFNIASFEGIEPPKSNTDLGEYTYQFGNNNVSGTNSSFDLALNHNTDLGLYIKGLDSITNIKATCNDEPIDVNYINKLISYTVNKTSHEVSVTDKRYEITIPNISSLNLNKKIKIEICNQQTIVYTLEIYPLSYSMNLVNGAGTSSNYKNCAIAIYDFCMASHDYQNALS